MSKDLLRILGTLIIAFGLMAGSLAAATAGDFVEVDNEFEADQDAEGGDADNEVDNDQDIENDQENDQEQDQDADQDQDVDQEGENDLDQENVLVSATGGTAGGDCDVFQDEIAENLDSDFDTDTADGDQTANAGAEDSAACQHGDSSVGDSTGGDSNQANAAEQGVENENDASQDLGDQSQTNDMDNENQQAIVNDLDADGGDADADAEAVFVNEIVAVLVEILGSILGSGDGNTIGDTDTDTGTEPVLTVPLEICEFIDGQVSNNGEVTLEEVVDAIGGADAEAALLIELLLGDDFDETDIVTACNALELVDGR